MEFSFLESTALKFFYKSLIIYEEFTAKTEKIPS